MTFIFVGNFFFFLHIHIMKTRLRRRKKFFHHHYYDYYYYIMQYIYISVTDTSVTDTPNERCLFKQFRTGSST